jgi:hypothetical protein
MIYCTRGEHAYHYTTDAVDFIQNMFKTPGQTKDYKIGICCFSDKHAALRRKNEDWLAHNQDNVSEWGDMSIRGLLNIFYCRTDVVEDQDDDDDDIPC